MTPEEQAHAAAVGTLPPATQPRRRLSWLRVLGVLLAVAAAAAGTVAFHSRTRAAQVLRPSSSFAPYVDVTATPQYAFENATHAADNLVLGFVVSAKDAACTPSWGASYSLDSAATTLNLDRRIARLRQIGGQVSVSFGGAANSELAIGCNNTDELTAAYQRVVSRYALNTIDLDIEGPAASAPDVDTRRAQAIAKVQQHQRSAGHPLQVWLTLPVSPDGLTSSGLQVLDAMLSAHVQLSGVNALTMDYGQPLAAHQTMAALAEGSLSGLAKQLQAALRQHGRSLSSEQVWQHVGATPMIGQNDTVSERFELSDARTLVTFARKHDMRRLSMWSDNRDQSCGPNYANVEVVSPDCSGVSQNAGQFARIFGAFTTKGSAPIGGIRLPSLPKVAADVPDNPATSPYPIWNPAQAYPANTEIVWQHNVYQAKWYTQGNAPDAPVANASQTPWTLIGPVLRGEHPAKTAKLPPGTYRAWSATGIYLPGDRVQYQGIGYQAKWWTQGDQPGAPDVAASASPWQELSK